MDAERASPPLLVTTGNAVQRADAPLPATLRDRADFPHAAIVDSLLVSATASAPPWPRGNLAAGVARADAGHSTCLTTHPNVLDFATDLTVVQIFADSSRVMQRCPAGTTPTTEPR